MVLTPSHNAAFTSWYDEIKAFIDHSESFVIGIFDANGEPVYLSGGMQILLGCHAPGDFVPDHFVVPRFEVLRQSAAPADSDLVFQGWLTFGGEHLPHRSVFGEARRRDGMLLVLAEYDVEELERVNREITQLNGEITNLQRELARRKNQLEQALVELRETQIMLIHSEKMSALGQIVAGVAHEINNPISFVTSNLHSLRQSLRNILGAYRRLEQAMLAGQDEDSEEIVQQVREMFDLDFLIDDLDDLLDGSSEGLRRVKQIVEDLRLFSRLDEAEFKEADLLENIRSTLAIVQPELRDRIQINIEFEPLPKLLCYPAELNQVFMNLIVNAAQAIEDSGTVTIRGYGRGEHIFLEFEDTGQGMPPEVLSRIFTPFFTTKPAGSGTGLGLALSKKIIEEHHHGTITVTSTPGEGSIFTIKLPKDLRND